MAGPRPGGKLLVGNPVGVAAAVALRGVMATPVWHQRSLEARLPFLRRRAELTSATRAFFVGRGYQEVETPYAVPVPGEEVHLRAFATRRERPDGSSEPLWLHTSPEFAMKRLLVGGAGTDLPVRAGLAQRRGRALCTRPSSPCWNGTGRARTWTL
jgi:hypothetical protein